MRNRNLLEETARMGARECEIRAGYHRREAARRYGRANGADRAERARLISEAFWHDHTARAFEARGRALREAGL